MDEVVKTSVITRPNIVEFNLHEIYYSESMLSQVKREYEDLLYENELTRQKIVHHEQEIAAPNRVLVRAVQGFLSLGQDIPFIVNTLDLSIEEIHYLATFPVDKCVK